MTTFMENKKKLPLQFGAHIVLIAVLGGVCYLKGVPVGGSLFVVIFLSLISLSRCVVVLKREYWVRVSDTDIEYHDSSAIRLSGKYAFSEIKGITCYYGGVILFLKHGPVRRINIISSLMDDPKAFKTLVNQKWKCFQRTRSNRGGLDTRE